MTSTESTDQPAGVRASNSDRERVASILRAAGTEGLLTLAEMDERLALAYSATYRHDLEPLTADLPGGGRPLYSHSPEYQAQRAEFQARHRRGMIRHGVVAAAVVATAITIWAVLGHAHHFFPGPIIAIAVISLAIHARRAHFGYGPRFGYGPGHGDPWSGRAAGWHQQHQDRRGDYWA
jgi:hypothetical protein